MAPSPAIDPCARRRGAAEAGENRARQLTRDIWGAPCACRAAGRRGQTRAQADCAAHARCWSRRRQPPPQWASHDTRRTRRPDQHQIWSTVGSPPRARTGSGSLTSPSSRRPRVPLPRGRARCLEPQDRRLVDGEPSPGRTGARCSCNGDRSAATARRDPPQRSGQPIRLWRSASAARKPAFGPPWARSATPMTTPCARASSQRSRANCWIAAVLRHRPRHASRASASSRGSTMIIRTHISLCC